jgi:hypothetical protein
MKRWSRLAKVLLATCSTFVLLELALQVLAIAAWLSGGSLRSATVVRAADTKVVLCIGDSFTYGMGASDPDFCYPSQLEERLQDRFGRHWRVVNRGWPGNDSHELRKSVARDLAEVQPDVVCLLVGANDVWRQRERCFTSKQSDSFAWRLRTADLVRLLFRGQQLFRDDDVGEDPSSDPGRSVVADGGEVDFSDHPMVGLWWVGDARVPVRISEDGICDITGSQTRWRPDGNGLLLLSDGKEVSVGVEIHEGIAVIEMLGSELRLSRTPPAGVDLLVLDAERSIFVAVRKQQWSAVVDRGQRLLKLGERAQILRIAPIYVEAALRIGRTELARDAIGAVRQLYDGDADESATIALLSCLQASKKYAEAYGLATSWGDGDRPFSPKVTAMRANLAILTLSRSVAMPILDAAIEILRDYPKHGPELWSLWCRLYKGGDLQLVVKRMLALWRSAPADSMLVRLAFTAHADRVRGLLEEAAIADGLNAMDAKDFRDAVLDTISDDDSVWRRTLAVHIEEIADMAQAAGAELVVGLYPAGKRSVRDTLIAVAQRRGLALADASSSIPKNGSERKAYFVADGHCSDRGYAVVAQAFCDAIVQAQKRD